MVKLRLKRLGKKNSPFYRIVAIPARTKREGKTLEDLGHYDPIKKELKLDKERAEYWLNSGAQPTDTVKRLLIKEGVIKEDKSEKKSFKKEPGRKAQERKAKKDEKKEEPAKKEEKETEVKEEKDNNSEEK